MKKLFIAYILLLSITVSYSGVVSDFTSEVKNKCPEANTLLIKKTMLELLSNDLECGKTFSKKLLLTCEHIKCSELSELLKTIKKKYDGSVIGR